MTRNADAAIFTAVKPFPFIRATVTKDGSAYRITVERPGSGLKQVTRSTERGAIKYACQATK
jgi:hypothetical protein